MDFKELSLQRTIAISKLYSVHYFEFSKNYAFTGESHDFWEIVYVDKGELIVTAGQEDISLSSGEVYFHAPNEWHNIRANGTTAPNVMILSFQCRSAAMQLLTGKRMNVDTRQREYLSQILLESRQAFSSNLDDPFDHTLLRAKDAPLGSEQLIGLYLTLLLISMLRRLNQPSSTDRKSGSLPLLDAITEYMEQNLSRKMTMSMLAAKFHVSGSYIKKLFSQYKQTGAMHYLIGLRIARAKDLLRESDHNVSQIAELLGYENIYYFCNQFKKQVGMSPLEYRRSIKALADRVRAKME